MLMRKTVMLGLLIGALLLYFIEYGRNPYRGWTAAQAGGIVEFKIPPQCKAGDGAAGSMYFICPTSENPEPTPDFVVSSDSIQVNFSRWENFQLPYWDLLVGSIKVKTPLTHEIQININ